MSFKSCSPLHLLYTLIGDTPQSATFNTANVRMSSDQDDRRNTAKAPDLQPNIKMQQTASPLMTLAFDGLRK